MEHEVEVTIVGGAAAGLAAAVTLGRSLRSVMVIDSGHPRNEVSEHAHNLLGQEGISPAELLRKGRSEASGYGVEFIDDEAIEVTGESDGFVVTTARGERVRGRRLLLATGLQDELPSIPGVREGWGRTVLHCPYCHGWEFRGRRIVVLGTSPLSVHQTLMFRQLSDDVTLVLHHPLPAEELEEPRRRGVQIVEQQVQSVTHDSAGPTVHLVDGAALAADAVVVAPRFVTRSALWEQLGGTLTDHPMGMGSFVATGPMARTDIDGVYAAGNVAELAAMVSLAAAQGTQAGAAINADLVMNPA